MPKQDIQTQDIYEVPFREEDAIGVIAKYVADKIPSRKNSVHLKEDNSYEQKVVNKEDKIVSEVTNIEDRATGMVDTKIIKSYIKMMGVNKFVIIFVRRSSLTLVLSIYSFLNYMSNWFLQYWIKEYDDKTDVLLFFGLSILILVASNFARIARSIVLMVGSIDVTRVVNFEMLFSLGYASLNRFFDKVPIGRVLNRFAKDTQVIDLNLFNQIDKTTLLL